MAFGQRPGQGSSANRELVAFRNNGGIGYGDLLLDGHLIMWQSPGDGNTSGPLTPTLTPPDPNNPGPFWQEGFDASAFATPIGNVRQVPAGINWVNSQDPIVPDRTKTPEGPRRKLGPRVGNAGLALAYGYHPMVRLFSGDGEVDVVTGDGAPGSGGFGAQITKFTKLMCVRQTLLIALGEARVMWFDEATFESGVNAWPYSQIGITLDDATYDPDDSAGPSASPGFIYYGVAPCFIRI